MSTTSSLRSSSRPPRLSRCVRSGFDVYLRPKDLVEKVADLHFLALSSSRCGTHRPHPFQASSGSFRLPRWSPCDHFGFMPTVDSELCSFTFQVQAQLDLLWYPLRTKSYKNVFQLLPEELVEKVSTLHFPSFVRNTQIPSVPSLETLELRPWRNKTPRGSSSSAASAHFADFVSPTMD